MTVRSSRLKRKLEPEPRPCIRKKLRSKLHRRRRCQISPVLVASKKFKASEGNVISVDSSSCFRFNDEESCNSTRISVEFESKGRSGSMKDIINEVVDLPKDGCNELRRIRRSEKQEDGDMEVSESSCVDSNSGVVGEQRNLVLKFRSGKESKNAKETETNEGSEAFTKSETTCEEQCSAGTASLKFSSEITGNDVVPAGSRVPEKFGKNGEETLRGKEHGSSELEFAQVFGNHRANANTIELNAQSSIQQGSNHIVDDSDLTCTEQFSYGDLSEYSLSQETEFPDQCSDIFPESSELEISDYFTDSGSQFSDGSVTGTASPTFSLFIQYNNEFSRLTSPDTGITLCAEDDTSHQPEFLRFEDAEVEESYQMLRKRERGQLLLCNYAEKYCSNTTDHGKLVLQQRSHMVHWIIEQSCRRELRQETMFLGVSLLDRFLSKGYFKTKKNLQIVGIACLTLATRIEENQPNNSVRQKNFYVGSTMYSRCEVVAMEWMVQEVLSFRCLQPTIYNFLWFYLKAAEVDAKVEKRIKFLATLALSAQEQMCYWPSTVAAALVILGCLDINENASHKVIGIHVRSKDENLHICIEHKRKVIESGLSLASMPDHEY
ncbi:cyclin-SDS-like [Neltuma alba]|uniref:cyclin-SDS-like n=1 Tax=Neltuma alba TaxID=207710 RepID=UPI0010A2A9CE|nr:cyclin-SDS-like [Prosopis alba]